MLLVAKSIRPFIFVFSALVLTAVAPGCGSDETSSNTTGQGGSKAQSSSSSTGGSSGDGGSSAKGGSSADGGSSAKGGSTADGGSSADGGSAAQGGAGGQGGATAQGGAGGQGTGGNMGMAQAECTQDSDCKLVNDCCTCEGLPNNTPGPVCASVCKVPMCQSTGLPLQATASCRVGRCVAGYDCRIQTVTCKQPQPLCKLGETNSVQNGCWGPCVPATECLNVSLCSQCAAGQRCVNKQAKLNGGRHCVEIPSSCKGNATCACMGASVCLAPHDTCGDAKDALICSCPNC